MIFLQQSEFWWHEQCGLFNDREEHVCNSCKVNLRKHVGFTIVIVGFHATFRNRCSSKVAVPHRASIQNRMVKNCFWPAVYNNNWQGQLLAVSATLDRFPHQAVCLCFSIHDPLFIYSCAQATYVSLRIYAGAASSVASRGQVQRHLFHAVCAYKGHTRLE